MSSKVGVPSPSRRARCSAWARAALAALAQAIDLRDILWLGGLAAVGYGIAQIYPPAAWIVCGAAIFWKGERS